MSSYDIRDKEIKKYSEATSAVATISYEVENAQVNVLDKNDINKQIIKLQGADKFPSNLQLVDAFYDLKTFSSCFIVLYN